MEPVGWVSCGCGKGVSIYARKQQAKELVEHVAKALGDEKGQPWDITRHMEHQPFKKDKAAADSAPGQQRLCAKCGKPFKAKKYLKYCTYACYIKAKESKNVPLAELEDPTPVEAPWKTTPEETKELLETLES